MRPVAILEQLDLSAVWSWEGHVLVISLLNTTKDRPTAYGDKTRAVSTVTKVAQGQVNDETMQSKSSSIWKRIAGKLGINIPIVLLMIKYVIDLPHLRAYSIRRKAPVASAHQESIGRRLLFI